MTNTADRVTRVAADLMDSAAVEGARQSRSAKQQLDHWARVGREVSSQQTAARRRVEAALAGELELRELSRRGGCGLQRRDRSRHSGKSGAHRTTASCSPRAESRQWPSTRTVTSLSTAPTGLRSTRELRSSHGAGRRKPHPSMKRLDLVVGPNGAGKSTFVELTLAPLLPGSAFVNADEIAKQRWPDDPAAHSIRRRRGSRHKRGRSSSSWAHRSSPRPCSPIRQSSNWSAPPTQRTTRWSCMSC